MENRELTDKSAKFFIAYILIFLALFLHYLETAILDLRPLRTGICRFLTNVHPVHPRRMTMRIAH